MKGSKRGYDTLRVRRKRGYDTLRVNKGETKLQRNNGDMKLPCVCVLGGGGRGAGFVLCVCWVGGGQRGSLFRGG